MSIREKTITGIFWTLSEVLFLRFAGFFTTLIMARLLGPVEFGLIAMTSLFTSLGVSLVDSGMSSSLIRSSAVDERDFSTVFFLNLAFSLFAYGVVYVLAPYVSLFYKRPELSEILRVYCLSFIIAAFSSVQRAILIKGMQFRERMLNNIPGTLIGFVAGVLLAYRGLGVWSLIWMNLITQAIGSVTLWINSKWRPRFLFSQIKASEHLHFGYKLTVSGIINVLFNEIYTILIGRYFPVQSIGLYERARRFNVVIVQSLSETISSVTYPLLSQISDDKEQLSLVYKRLLKLTFFISVPLMLGLGAISKPLFLLVMGNEWLSAAPLFSIMCLASIFYPVHAFNLNIFKVLGRSDLFLRLEIVKKTVIVICITIGFQFGLLGLVWTTVVTSTISLLINTYYSGDMIQYSTIKQLTYMIPVLISGLLTASLAFYISELLGQQALYLQVFLPVLASTATYGIIHYLFKSESLFYLLSLIKKRL